MDVTTLLTFSLAFLLAAATPGPGIAAVIARALASGLRPTLPMIAGLVVGDLIYITFAVFGLAVVATQMGALFLLIKWAGVAYLLYMAWSLWTAPTDGPALAARASGGAARSFVAGLFVTLGNPKVMIFYLALLPTLVDLPRLTVLEFVELVLLVTTLLTLVMTSYAILASRARSALASPRAVRAVNRGAGAAMAGAAVSIAAR